MVPRLLSESSIDLIMRESLFSIRGFRTDGDEQGRVFV